MNKFVKGAKNLAFALSFVTVAACGNVKKADLETALKGLEEKMDGKLNGKTDKSQGYALNSDVDSKIANGKSEVLKEIENVRGKMVSREDVVKGCIKKGGVDFDFLKKSGVDLEGVKFEVSVVNEKIVIKSGSVVVYEDFKVEAFGAVEFIEGVVSLNGSFDWDTTFGDNKRFQFIAAGDNERIKVGGLDTTTVEGSIKLVGLLGKVGKKVFEKFFDRNVEVLGGTANTVCGKTLKTVWDKIKGDEEAKKEFGKGLMVLFGEEGEFTVGATGTETRLTDKKNGFVFKKAVKNVAGIDLES